MASREDYCLWIVSPEGYLHSRCFEEVALALRDAFQVLGFAAPIVTDAAHVRGRAIVLGANLLTSLPGPLPARLVLCNFEQIAVGSPWLSPAYLDLLRQYPVWDYSADNVKQLAALGVRGATLCGVGYMPALTRIAPADESIDVLFIGSLNDRRRAVLQELAEQGKHVVATFNAYGHERDQRIAAAKLVLNVHFYESRIFEIVRISYLLANRRCVVSETGPDEPLEAPFRDGVAFAPYERLVQTCLRLLADPSERQRLATAGFECFRGQSQVEMLDRALAALSSSS